MLLNLQLVTPPAAEPVSLTLAKQHLRVSFTDDDTYIPMLIITARQYCERYTHRKFFNQTWQRTMDYFPIWIGGGTVNTVSRRDWMYYGQYWNDVMIELPGQVNAINSITYLSSLTNTVTTLAPTDYIADLTSIPCRIVPAQGMTWPVQEVYAPGSVVIQYVAGSYGDGIVVNTCPNTIVMAILLLVDHWYNNRSASSEQKINSVPMAVNALLDCEKMEAWEIQ